MIDARIRKNLDVLLLLTALFIGVLGVVAIYSATFGSPARFYQKQALWFVVGLAFLVGGLKLDYHKMVSYARPLYIINLLTLIAVLVVAPEVKGSQRWISIGAFQFQPSESAKLIVICCLAAFLVDRVERIKEPGVLLSSLAYLGIPMLLIFRQPDLGTSLVLIAVWFGMVFIAGARVLHLVAILMAGLVMFWGMWHFNVLKPYQKDRLAAFVDPRMDPRGAGYQVNQSRIAIGSGKVWGKGLKQGSQGQGDFIPENHTDFIFTVVGEEGGFAASAAVVLLYGLLILRGSRAMAHAPDLLGRLIAAGILSMFAYHLIVNIGMVTGIMPVTGVPLPLFSYGGSSMMLNMACIGLLLGIGMRRHSIVF